MQITTRINEVLDLAADTAADVVNSDVLATCFAQVVASHTL